MENRCPICGAPLKNGSCDYCGYTNQSSIQEEGNANSVLERTGSAQEPQIIVNNFSSNPAGFTPGASKKSKTTALLLCIFLGWMGAHRFYVGKTGSGVLYLFTAGGFVFGWMIDIILIAAGSFRDEFGLPLLQ